MSGHQRATMTPEEAAEAVGKRRGRARFRTGQLWTEGNIVSYSIVPMVCIEARSGEKTWVRYDMVEDAGVYADE